MPKKENKPEFTNTPKIVNFTSNEVIEHEPFLIVNREGKYLIALTNSIVSNKEFDTYEEAGAYIDSKPWDLLINTIAFAINKLNEK